MPHRIYLYLSKPIFLALDVPSVSYLLAVRFDVVELDTAVKVAFGIISFLLVSVRFVHSVLRLWYFMEEKREKKKSKKTV